MAEWQEYVSPAVGSVPGAHAPSVPAPLVPTLDDEGEVILEFGESRIGALPANGVRFRSRAGNVDHRWGPLAMRVVLTTHRVVLIGVPGPPEGAPWSTPGSVPFALRAIEPSQRFRGLSPVRIAGHVRWDRVTRVEADDNRVTLTVPAALGAQATLTMHVPSQLGHRFLVIGRTAFVNAKRRITVDSRRRVEAELTAN